ncbi:MAG: glycosyltransferase family 4 protein [Eggerthellaceae bacterium]|jgi:glycosyltransferase involved in cell wall biosynthesis
MKLRIAFFSNYLNEHQLPLCQAWASMEDVDFTFIALSEHGGNVGRRNMNDEYDFVLREYADGSFAEVMHHACEDDVVVFGDMGGKEEYVKARMAENRLSFRATERSLKRGYLWRFFPPKAVRMQDWFLQYKRKNMFVLCASAYAAGDLLLCGWPLDKCFRWGYFPDVGMHGGRQYHSHQPLSILWAARLIEWKRPFEPLRLAERLKASGYPFTLAIAGDGPLRKQMDEYIDHEEIGDVVTMLGALPGDAMKEKMIDADIYLTTANHKEGWGVTVNEAMGAGCAVVASASTGSAPYLIDDGANGLLYDDFDKDDLYRKVSRLLESPDLCRKLGEKAKETIDDAWSASVAAERFVSLSMNLLRGQMPVFEDGPCSKAPVLRNGWYHKVAKECRG